MQRVVVETAAVVLVGNELLSGKVADANLVELARTLRASRAWTARADVTQAASPSGAAGSRTTAPGSWYRPVR